MRNDVAVVVEAAAAWMEIVGATYDESNTIEVQVDGVLISIDVVAPVDQIILFNIVTLNNKPESIEVASPNCIVR